MSAFLHGAKQSSVSEWEVLDGIDQGCPVQWKGRYRQSVKVALEARQDRFEKFAFRGRRCNPIGQTQSAGGDRGQASQGRVSESPIGPMPAEVLNFELEQPVQLDRDVHDEFAKRPTWIFARTRRLHVRTPQNLSRRGRHSRVVVRCVALPKRKS